MGHRNQADSSRDGTGFRTTLPPAADGEYGDARGTARHVEPGTTMSRNRGGRGCRTYCSCTDAPASLCGAYNKCQPDTTRKDFEQQGQQQQSVRGGQRGVRDGASSSQNYHSSHRGGVGAAAAGGTGASREDCGGAWGSSKRRQSPCLKTSGLNVGQGSAGLADLQETPGLKDRQKENQSNQFGFGVARGRSRPGRGGMAMPFTDTAEESLKRDPRDAREQTAIPPAPLTKTHPALTGQAICPTPYVLGSVCARGEREYPHWRAANNSHDLLGNHAQMMADTVKYVFDIVVGQQGNSKLLRVLSAADGCADDMLPDIQAKYVPTSVMLAHTFMASQGLWQEGRARVQLYGGDLRNAIWPWWQKQSLPWHLPSWLGHRFVGLDNCKDFSQQLYANGQCTDDMRFDAVLVRQGLCFCDDPSKVSSTWPIEVAVTQAQEGPACGIYTLEPFTQEGRPAYRKGNCVLQWCPQRGEWAILDEAGGAWAYARADVGHPVLARGPWNIWNGTAHVSDATFACNLAQYGTPPWQRPVSQRICCCGVTGDMESVAMLLLRISAVLDPYNLHSFSLVHGAWTNGTRTEVDELHRQIEDATRLYNSRRRGPHVAAVLRRTAASYNHYWLQCDGIILFQPGSRADPYAAYGPGAVFDNTLSFYNPNPLPGSAP